MTKKEAFNYLKGTKVVLKTEDEQVMVISKDNVMIIDL